MANAAIPSRPSQITGLEGSITVIPGRYTTVSPTSVAVNTRGPFVRMIPLSTAENDRLPRFGGYGPGTLESRVLQLLHEMGHLVITDVKRYLIPRNRNTLVEHVILSHLLPIDGGNASLSRSNTTQVQNACGRQINAIR